MKSPLVIPEFEKGSEYRRLGDGRWKWVTTRPTVVRFVPALRQIRGSYRCLDGDGRQWMSLDRFRLEIPTGYAWNGSSCSPDIRGVMLASCVHDAIYQFSGCNEWPAALGREWADDIFYHLSTSRLRVLYACGLAVFSSLCWGRRPGDGSRVVKDPDTLY